MAFSWQQEVEKKKKPVVTPKATTGSFSWQKPIVGESTDVASAVESLEPADESTVIFGERPKKKTFREKYKEFTDSIRDKIATPFVTEVVAPIGTGAIRSGGSLIGAVGETLRKTGSTKGVSPAKSLPHNAITVLINKIIGDKDEKEEVDIIKDQVSKGLLKGEEFLTKYADRADKAIVDLSEKEAGYIRKVAQGLGSSIPYLAGGLALKGAQVTPWVASMGMSGIEALTNGYEDYKENVSSGMDEKDATKRAWGSFMSNFVIGTVTNKLGGFFDDLKPGVVPAFKRFLSTTVFETSEEVGQQLISNVFTGKPLLTGLGETALVSLPISAIFGGAAITQTVTPTARGKAEDIVKNMADEGMTREQMIETLSAVPGSDVAKIEESINQIATDINLDEQLEKNSQEVTQKQIDEVTNMFQQRETQTEEQIIEEGEKLPDNDVAFSEKKEETVSFTQEAKELKTDLKRLGIRGVDVVLANKIITPDNKEAYGFFFDNTIGMEEFVKPTTGKHELGHAIFRNIDNIPLFKNFDTKILFDEAAVLHPEDKSDRIQLEERIMEDFQEYVKERLAKKPTTFTGKVLEFFKTLFRQFKLIFSHRSDLQAFYQTIYEGKSFKTVTLENQGKIVEMLKEGEINFTDAFAFSRKENISQNDMEAEYALMFEIPTETTTEGKETKTLINKNTISQPDKITVTKSEQKFIKSRLKEQEKGFKAGEKKGIKIGKAEQETRSDIEKEEIKRKGLLKALQDNITRRSYINQSLDAIRKNIPPSERFKYMSALARIGKTASLSTYQNLLEDIYTRSEEIDIEKGESKEKARKRSTIAFLRKINSLSPTLVKDVKKMLAIEGSITKLDNAQLSKVLQEIKNRIDYLKRNNLFPKVPQKNTQEETIAIAEEALSKRTVRAKVKETSKTTWKEFKSGSSNLLETVSSILRSIDPVLNERLRTLEFNVKEYLNKQYEPKRKNIEKLLSDIKKKSKVDKLAVELALENGDIEIADNIIKSHGLDPAPIYEIREVLDDLYNKLTSIDIDVGYLKNMFPRMVKESAKTTIAEKYNDEIKRMTDELRTKEGRDLTEDEKAVIFTKYYRGFDAGNKIFLGAGRFDKSRSIPIINTAEVANYYEDLLTSLDIYVNGAMTLYEARKFFGKLDPKLQIEEADFNLSIGYLAEKLEYEGKINAAQNEKLQNALQAYFGTVNMSSAETFFINAAYVLGLGRITSAIPQLSETAMYIALNDVSRAELNSFRKFNITPQDINMELLYDNKELNIKKFAEYLTLHVRLSDRIPAQLGLNGLFRAIKNDAKKQNSDGTYGTKELRQKIEWIFGADSVNRIIGDINATSYDQAGKELSYEIRRILHSEIGRYRVLSRMDKTPVFIRHPLWGVFKTYTLKMIESIRTEGQQEIRNGIKEGNKAKIANGVQKKAFLILALLIAGAGQRAIKDWIKGKDDKALTDYAIDAILGMIGLSKYGFDTFSQYGLGGIITDIGMPAPVAIPVNIIESIMKDIKGHKGNAKTLQFVPLIGDILYNRL